MEKKLTRKYADLDKKSSLLMSDSIAEAYGSIDSAIYEIFSQIRNMYNINELVILLKNNKYICGG